MKKKLRLLLSVYLLVLAVCGLSITAGAANKSKAKTGWVKSGSYYTYQTKGKTDTGWKKISGKYYYLRKKAEGNAPLGSRMTGLCKVGSSTFYFSKKGVLQTGWVKVNGKIHYFAPTGKAGKIGVMYTGMKKIGKYRYLFRTDGSLTSGWATYKKNRYLFSTSSKLGVRGRALTGWIKNGGAKYYFNASGIMQKNRWIDEKYYVGSNGKLLKNTVTPDGYIVDAEGLKQGPASGKETEKESESEDTTDNSAKKTGKKILILSGHGQGDVGAMATIGKTTYREYKLTREFAQLIYQDLLSSSLNVTLYNQNYDLYQVMSKKKSGPIPNLKEYDYILEIHFNATVVAGKDLKGDGSFKGVGMYINSKKKNYKLDSRIVKAVAGTGFRVWGGGDGVFKSSGLFNAKTCQAAGVSYGLLETAFIDDKDDMTYYNKNKKKMAQAVASALVDYFK